MGFTIHNGHPYCEACHVRLRMPKCGQLMPGAKRSNVPAGCGKPIRDEVVEALGRKWHWACFRCGSCNKPFEEPAFFQRNETAYCEPCYKIILKNEF
jgi:NAD-dependent SIR2 family protein deacetylase